MQTVKFSKLAVFAVVTAVLAGCGQAGSLFTASTDASGKAQDRWAGKPGDFGKGGPGGARGGEMAFGFGADLSLTDDQKAKLKALMEQNKPSAPPSHNANDAHKALEDLLVGEKIDDAALRAAIAAVEAEDAARPHPDMAANIKAVYDILSVDQRAKIVAKLQALPTPPEHSPRPEPSDQPADKRLETLNLSAEQKAAWDALMAKMRSAHDANKPGDMNAKMIAFWQTGDTAGLTPPAPPAFPVEEFVKVAELLEQAQRKALLGHDFFKQHGPGKKGGHRGRKGHHDGFGPGGFGGFDGPGGPGGPGGPRPDAPAPSASSQ